ncbi:MAG TPA: 50S ribosomal protein L15 [Gammaproteobacteria bacterium]
MRLNTIKPGAGSKPAAKRLGRGGGSGLGKTSGRGHKGQRARAGGFHKVGFEGGQMPIQRRLPKIGFKSQKSLTSAQVSLGALARVDAAVIDLAALKAANVITKNITQVKVFLSGDLKKAVAVKGLAVTKGARSAIEAAGGKVES